MAEGGRIELTAELNGSHAGPFRCADCGASGTVPAHAPWHPGPYHAARLWNSGPAHAARAALAELHDFMHAPAAWEPPGAEDEWLTGYAALCGRLDSAMAELLAQIDREAGAL